MKHNEYVCTAAQEDRQAGEKFIGREKKKARSARGRHAIAKAPRVCLSLSLSRVSRAPYIFIRLVHRLQ